MKMQDLLKELREHERDYPELIHGPLCGQAADAIGRITAERDGYKRALELIAAFRGKTIFNFEPEYSAGANAAFEQAADIAIDALATSSEAAAAALSVENERLRKALRGLLEIEYARIATGAFTPNTEAQGRIDAARAALATSSGATKGGTDG